MSIIKSSSREFSKNIQVTRSPLGKWFDEKYIGEDIKVSSVVLEDSAVGGSYMYQALLDEIAIPDNYEFSYGVASDRLISRIFPNAVNLSICIKDGYYPKYKDSLKTVFNGTVNNVNFELELGYDSGGWGDATGPDSLEFKIKEYNYKHNTGEGLDSIIYAYLKQRQEEVDRVSEFMSAGLAEAMNKFRESRKTIGWIAWAKKSLSGPINLNDIYRGYAATKMQPQNAETKNFEYPRQSKSSKPAQLREATLL